MAKKILSFLLMFLFVFNLNAMAYQNISFGSFYIGENVVANANLEDANAGLNIPAKSSILIEQTTGKVLYQNNADEKLPPASITKIMTLLIVMEHLESGAIKLEDKVNISKHAMSMGGSQIWLEPGENMTVDDLLKATAVASANDASVALGEHIDTTEEAFVERMNKRSKELGMINTTFKNATGLDADGHISTARDISIMSKELLKHEYILKYTTTWMDTLRGGETQLVNTNKLVRFYEGATGLKTGTTDGAGSCLSASASRNGLNLVAVVMGSATSDDRFASAKTLLDYGFSKYEAIDVPLIDPKYNTITVKNGVKENIELDFSMKENKVIIPKGQKENINIEIKIEEYINAPVEKNQAVGKVIVKLKEDILSESIIYTCDSVDKMNFSFGFLSILKSLFKN